jgi:hypothetical protein
MTDSQKPNDTSRKLNILLTEDNLVNRVLARSSCKNSVTP